MGKDVPYGGANIKNRLLTKEERKGIGSYKLRQRGM